MQLEQAEDTSGLGSGFSGDERPSGLHDTARRARVLVVDDEPSGRWALEKLLRDDGFSTVAAEGGEDALAEVAREAPDLILTDLHMPRMSGVELCKRVHEVHPGLPVIVMTAFGEMASAVESLRAGAEDYLLKPLEYEVVRMRIDRAIARRPATREQEQQRLETADLHRELNGRLVLSSIREQEHADAEEKLRAQQSALLETLSEGVLIADAGGQVVMVNAAARAIVSSATDSPLTVEDLHREPAYHVDGRPLRREERPITRALRGETFADYEIQRVRPDGERRRLVSTGTSVRDARGEVSLALVVFRDVTELRKLEQQRDEYLALVSHDLRNPLNSILMLTSSLRRSMETKGLVEEAGFAKRAERNVVRLNAMIAELTEIATLESQLAESKRDACNLRDLVGGIVERMDDDRARRICIDADDASPHVVLGDASRLERVVANLMTNALKYSADDAPVRVHLSRIESAVVVDVIDRGIGIEPENIEKLFDRYYRTAAGKGLANGFGLGLYIARMIAEAHHGRIEVVSEVGVGSRFRLILPARGDLDAAPLHHA